MVFCIQEPLIAALQTLAPSPLRDLLIRQLDHAAWDGCTFFDLGFPAYILLIAMSMTYSFRNRRARGQTSAELYRRLIARSALLYVFGIFFHGGFSVPLSEVRFTRIFHRLAVAILFSGLIELTFTVRRQIALLVLVLVGYWGLMAFVAAPGYEPGDYSPQGNLSEYVDKVLLGARTYFVLSTIGVVGTCILGLLVGHVLQLPRTAGEKAVALAVAGMVLVNLGFGWDVLCPVNRHLWTPSFVVFSGGWILIIFLMFYFPMEVLERRRWAFPTVVLGRNPLFTYVAAGILPFDRYAKMLVGEGLAPLFGAAHPFVLAFTQVGLLWLLVYWLHRKNLVIRI